MKSALLSGLALALSSLVACSDAPLTHFQLSAPGQPAPELDRGLAWLNTDAPLRLEELRGHIILLDFWTYGCVNCLHVLPELRALEEHFEGRPFVVIGVHSGKFEAEEDAGHIDEAIRRYDIRHPVLVDDDKATMISYAATAWPTRVLIDSEGIIYDKRSGEFDFETVRTQVDTLLDQGAEQGTLSASPKELYQDPNEGHDAPLLFPTSMSVSSTGALALSDTGHHRVVILPPDGEGAQVVGSAFRGFRDGDFGEASFSSPEGSAWLGDTLYVCDTENHAIREVDFASETVATIAGTGTKGGGRHQIADGWLDALTTPLRSPWALLPVGDEFIVAMAGSHQLYRMNPERSELIVFSGNGFERLTDGVAEACSYNQPSGLALSADGGWLFVADTEASAIRRVNVETGACETLVGVGLFDFGDVDGVGDAVRLQHPLDVVLLPDGKVALSDTYNDVLKRLDPATRAVETWDISAPEVGFAEPRGLALDGTVLTIADTNNHRIVAYDLESEASAVVDLQGLRAPLLSGVSESP